MDFSFLSDPSVWMAVLTLIFLEIVLGIDNIVFISIISNKLPEQDRPKARNIGLMLAMVFRIALLFGITWVLSLKQTLYSFDFNFISGQITGQSLIMFGGGIFLLYKSVAEIHHKLEGEEQNISGSSNTKNIATIILQICFLDMVFSFDSILTAVGMVSLDNPPIGFGHNIGMGIIITAIIVSVSVMMLFAGPVSKFVNNHPTIQILGLSFLILIGVMLLAEGSHLANVTFLKNHVNTIPKGYLYFAIFFSLFVEFINLKLKKKSQAIKLKNSETIDNL